MRKPPVSAAREPAPDRSLIWRSCDHARGRAVPGSIAGGQQRSAPKSTRNANHLFNAHAGRALAPLLRALSSVCFDVCGAETRCTSWSIGLCSGHRSLDSSRSLDAHCGTATASLRPGFWLRPAFGEQTKRTLVGADGFHDTRDIGGSNQTQMPAWHQTK
jgi:hypothetical protein